MIARFVSIAALVLSVYTVAPAATFCVSTTAQLKSAFDTAVDNGQDDIIYIVVGTYTITATLFFYTSPTETYDLKILGGMAPGCLSGLSSSGQTILDGQDALRIFSIDSAGSVSLGRITFQNAAPFDGYGGAVYLAAFSPTTPSYVFDNVFVANSAASGSGAGALYLEGAAPGDTYLLNNLFLANKGSDSSAVYIYGGRATFINGNTFVGNQLNESTGFGALDLRGTNTYWLGNNIMWNNAGADIYDHNGKSHFTHNDIGTRAGYLALSANGELSVDPEFGGFLSLRPSPDSPLVNAGDDSPPGGLGCCDTGGGERVIGKHVDIGAYETEVLFRYGFEK